MLAGLEGVRGQARLLAVRPKRLRSCGSYEGPGRQVRLLALEGTCLESRGGLAWRPALLAALQPASPEHWRQPSPAGRE